MPAAKKKKPFFQNGRTEPFVRKNGEQLRDAKRINTHELKADAFAQSVAESPSILHAFRSNMFTSPARHQPPKQDESIGDEAGVPLPKPFLDALHTFLDEDFSDVRIHVDAFSTQLTVRLNAAALTVGFHIYLNQHVFKPDSADGLYLLAHELYHAIVPGSTPGSLEIQLKPLTELHDQTPEQKKALLNAVKIAQGEKGEVNSSATNEDKTRVGWQFLLEYFKTTMGAESIVRKEDYKPGTFLEENIKYVKRGKATKIRIVDGKHTQVVEDNVDLLPSWCGIFAFWAYHKAGIHPPKWELGKPNFTSKDQYPKGEYLPRPGDLVIKSGFNHHAIVVRTIPETVTDTKDLQQVKVVTINGNTAGSNHQGGQIQEKIDPYSYWDYYVKPFFAGVIMTPAQDWKPDERLLESLGEKSSDGKPLPSIKPADVTITNHNASLAAVGDLGLQTSAEGKKKEPEKIEEAPIDPKKIMADDPAYKELNATLAKNAEKEQAHDTPEQKSKEAQESSVSPPKEVSGKAKAKKVEKLAALPRPKDFKAAELKANILKEVDRLIEEKKQEANDTGNKPKIKDNEIADVKKANQEDIKTKRKESIGTVEESHKSPPDESGIEKREAANVVLEDPGKENRIQHTEKAVAKPIAEERITLEEDSAKIDREMADNDVDEKQLEESNEPQFTGALDEKKSSQAKAADVKQDYQAQETIQLDADKKQAKHSIFYNVAKMHDIRKSEFGNVDVVKDKTKSADELKRKEVTDNIEKIYTDSEKSVKGKLETLEASVSTEFDAIMTAANTNFKKNCNDALDEEFTWEWAAKKLDRADYNKRVKKVFVNESEKYRKELSDALDPLTTKIANTLNAILDEIQAAKNAVIVYVEGLDPALAEIGVQSAKGALEKFGELEQSVNEKQEGLTNNLAKKYADGVMSLEKQFKEIMDSRKSWLEKALDAIINAIKEIINLFIDLKKALERAASYGKRIIKAPLKFFGHLIDGAKAGFNNFVKNIAKHLLQGALEWVTGEMGDAGIQLPEKFDFKGILSIILQILGISINNVKEIAKKVIGAKYVALLEKGVDLGVKAGDKILQVFTILKKDGIAGLWEFIKEQFSDLKERLMEEAKSFIVMTIVETAVIKLISMLIPGAGFISAVKSLIDFLRTLFAKARQIVAIITGIIDTFGEVLEGNVGKVSEKIEWVLAKFLSLAITFLAAILGLGKIGKKINDIIQKKIRDPINKAITKMMEKLKAVMTKLGVFKFLDKVEEKVKAGGKWVEEKKGQVKAKAKEKWDKFKKWLSLKKVFTTEGGESHSIYFDKSKQSNLMIASKEMTFTKFIDSISVETEKEKDAKVKAKAIAGNIDAKKKESIAKKDPSESEAKAFEDKKSKELNELFETLATKAAILFKTFNSPDTVANFGALDSKSEFGTSANILYLNKKFQKNGSPPTSSSPTVYQLLNKRRHGGGSYYIKGHLLNEKMGGKGEWSNLTPLSRTGNAQHETTIESVGKKFQESSAILSYDVKAIYKYSARKGEGDKTIQALKQLGDSDLEVKSKIIEAENHVPVSLDCSASLMLPSGDKFVKGPAVFTNKLVNNEIERGPKSYDIDGVKKVKVYLDVKNSDLKKQLATADFDGTLIDKIIKAKNADDNIRRYETLFALGGIVSDKDKEQIKDQVILYHAE